MTKRISVLLVLMLCGAFALSAKDDFKRERGKANDALKDSWEGKAPPKLEIKEWLNAEADAMQWDKLKGKVVLIDYWAFW